MKQKLFFISFLLLFSSLAFAQKFSGQWKGVFDDRSVASGSFGGSQCEYVIDLEATGTNVTGYSYTYYTDQGKRYYTICKLVGFLDKKKKYIEVKETERTKTNVPENIGNCFQIHRLNYSKEQDGNESLTGTWIPVPGQLGNCGFGNTSLMRRNLRSEFPNFKNNFAKTTTKSPVGRTRPPVAKTIKKAPEKKVTPPPVVSKAPVKKAPNDIVLKPRVDSFTKQEPQEKIFPQKAISELLPFEKRNNTLIKTIEVDNESVRVDLYDNGEVDGDSISLYYNRKLLLSHKRLSEQAITLMIPVPQNNEVNELVMYAENLGTIPPNTALMVVTDGKKRYEVRITSDLQKSGAIRFVHKKPEINKN